MDCAGKAGVEGADDPDDFNRIIGVGDGCADESFLHRAANCLVISRRGIPCRGDDALVVFDFGIFDINPVSECAAGGLGEACTLSRGGDRIIGADRAIGF